MSPSPSHQTNPADAEPSASTARDSVASPSVAAGSPASVVDTAAPLMVDYVARSDAPAATANPPADAAAVRNRDGSADAPDVADTPSPNIDAAPGSVAVAPTDTPKDAPTVLPRAPDLSPVACAELLKQHFPALFSGPPKPLKLRIQADIQLRAPGVFSKNTLSAYFRRYTGSTGYLIALSKASQRFDLDGQPAGELSEEHRQLAREELVRRRQITRDREQQAHAQQQAAQAELLQARQARAGLLRDYERTTLTPANFCALKGMKPDELTALLDQARREATEAPQTRPFDERRGPPGGQREPRAPHPDGHRDARPPRPGHREGPPRPGRPSGRPGGR